MITFALAKGRLASKILKILPALGVLVPETDAEDRRLVLESKDGKYRFFFSKPSDVPTYVEYGVADFGVVGKDTILEEHRDVVELLDLGFGACKMCVCGPVGKDIQEDKVIRVATKYPTLAKSYFEKTNRHVQLIKLNGSVELGPMVGLSDCIVDIVESGRTLAENNLEVKEVISTLSARLIANNASLKTKYEDMFELLTGFQRQVGEKND